MLEISNDDDSEEVRVAIEVLWSAKLEISIPFDIFN
ncbi:hypothetical protein LSPCS325_43080 [Lysinibacillus sp. CTST325]